MTSTKITSHKKKLTVWWTLETKVGVHLDVEVLSWSMKHPYSNIDSLKSVTGILSTFCSQCEVRENGIYSVIPGVKVHSCDKS